MNMEKDHTPEEALPLGHEYVGNICGGFGGKTECKWYDFETGRQCGKSPFEHEPMPPELAQIFAPSRLPEHVFERRVGRQVHPETGAIVAYVFMLDEWLEFKAALAEERRSRDEQ